MLASVSLFMCSRWSNFQKHNKTPILFHNRFLGVDIVMLGYMSYDYTAQTQIFNFMTWKYFAKEEIGKLE